MNRSRQRESVQRKQPKFLHKKRMLLWRFLRGDLILNALPTSILFALLHAFVKVESFLCQALIFYFLTAKKMLLDLSTHYPMKARL